MKKLLTKIVGATLGLALAIGVSVGVMNNREAKEVNATTYEWQKMTSTSEFVNGAIILITQGDYYLDASIAASNSCPAVTSLTLTNNLPSLTANSSKCFTVTTYQQSGLRLYAPNGTDYLYTNTSNNGTRIGTASTNGSLWTISSAGTNEFYLASNASTTRYLSRYSTQDFRSYTNTGTNANLVIYKLVETGGAVSPTVTVSPTSLFFRNGDSGQAVTASGSNFSGDVSYSWAHLSGDDCATLSAISGASITISPKNVAALSTGIYRVTAEYSSESATADVTVVVDNKGIQTAPYTVAEARAVIDGDNTARKNNVHVKGIVYQVDGYNSTYHSITYWISDNGTDSSPIEVYGGLSIEGQPDFSSENDIKAGDIVVVKGNVTKYGSVYEFTQNNHLVSRISVSSIAVKAAPTKVSYLAGENFDPTGLVVTATYNDATPTTKDFAYADLGNAFTFDPTTSVSLNNEDSVSITLFGATVSQDITVTQRTVTAVQLNGDMSKKAYYYNDSWDLTGLYLTLTWSAGVPSTSTANLTDLVGDAEFEYEFDKANASRGDTNVTVSGTYRELHFSKTITGITVQKHPLEDTLRTAATSLNITSGSYASFGPASKTVSDINSEATWAGVAMKGKGDSVQINGTTRGIYTTASSQFVKSVKVDYNDDNGKNLFVYGSNAAYTSIIAVENDENSTLLGTINSGNTSINVLGKYKYVYMYSSGATYMNSITVAWSFPNETTVDTTATRSTLSYRYTYDGNDYDYTKLALRFGGSISPETWAGLDDELVIQGYGVMISPTASIQDRYYAVRKETGSIDDSLNTVVDKNYKQVGETDIKCYYTALSALKTNPVADANGDYGWNLYVGMESPSESELKAQYTAVAFIRTQFGELIFFNETTKSAAQLAYDLIEADTYFDDNNNLEGSMDNLAYLYLS